MIANTLVFITLKYIKPLITNTRLQHYNQLFLYGIYVLLHIQWRGEQFIFYEANYYLLY